MSSPTHLDGHADPSLIYAPRSARQHIRPDDALRSRAGAVATRERSSRKVKPKFSGDRAVVELRRQLARDPDLIPQPAPESAAVIRALLFRVCGVTSLAALLAWSLVSYSGLKKAGGNISANVSAAAIASDHVNLADLQQSRLRPSLPQADQTPSPTAKPSAMVVTAKIDAVIPASRSVTKTPVTAAAPTGSAPVQGANDRRALRLDSEQIETLVKRGSDLLASGDLAAARLLLRRAAEAGSAEGALALATTFDPIVLQRLGVIGAAPDLAQARRWYQRAAELGSSAASQHLAGLGDVR